MPRRGILAAGAHLPWWRLERSLIAEANGGRSGRGTRAVASYDEDTTTMGVEAARNALSPLGSRGRDGVEWLWFATTAPAYADKTNATALHAALRLDRNVPVADANGALRSAVATLRSALLGGPDALVVAADARTGLPGSADERDGGDGAAALLVGREPDDGGPPLLAEHLGGASLTEEFTDRWREPGDLCSKLWEERFGETRYVPLGTEAWKLALDGAGVEAADVTVAVTGLHARAVGQVAKAVGRDGAAVADDLTAAIGNTGAAHPALLLTHLLEQAPPGQVFGVVVLADGADVLLFRATEAVRRWTPARSAADQVASGRAGLPYLTFLSWKAVVTVQPPNRPEPARTSSAAASRRTAWKFGLAGPDGAVADATGTVVTFTVDRLAYSPSPPVVFAVVDLDTSVRLAIELTDVVADDVAIGDQVVMTFRRLGVSDGIRNYHWKARPAR
jgi:3-hydroxy-3-methylglutaryl CoA synthase